MSAEIYQFPTGARLDTPTPQWSPAARDYLWGLVEYHEREAEKYKRYLGVLAVERGVPHIGNNSEGQLSLIDLDGEEV